MKKIISILIITISLFTACSNNQESRQIDPSNKITIENNLNNIELVESARKQIGIVTKYDTAYYSEGYPPEGQGACSDVLWRAFQETGQDFKKMIDDHIAQNTHLYPSDPILDSNINFRRVRNIRIFLEDTTQGLSTEVTPGNKENLSQWQPGDIVTYAQIPGGLWHIAIISDQRRNDGVPLLIHNYGSGVKEDDYLINWPTEITGHYRIDLS